MELTKQTCWSIISSAREYFENLLPLHNWGKKMSAVAVFLKTTVTAESSISQQSQIKTVKKKVL